MAVQPIQIASVNLRRRSKLLHGLLHDSHFDILLIQEPWFGKINVARDDSDPTGTDVLGATVNNMWDLFLPSTSPTTVCKVAIYIRRHITAQSFVRCRTDLSISSPSSMVVDISYETDFIRLINIYHDTPDKKSHLQHVTSFEIDPTIQTLVAGDFNTHGPSWSLPGATMSPWAPTLEDWFDEHGLTICNPPGVATWEGRNDQAPSVLDLLLINPPAALSEQFSDVSISFPLSLGSDHAALFLAWTPTSAIPDLPPTLLPGYVIDDDLKDTWSKAFAAIPTPVITSRRSLDVAAERIITDITDTCRPLFPRRRTPDPRGARWWSATCSAALTAVQTASPADRRQASRAFNQVLTQERRQWADEFLSHTTTHKLWEATRWRHGRRATRIPPLRKPDDSYAHSTEEVAPLLSTRFFPHTTDVVHPSHPDDPPSRPRRDWPPITRDEIGTALASTSNSSAPGISGVNYKLLKWAFASAPDRFTSLYNACLEWGTHPWSDAKVVPIPKPNKPDYSVPKAYRPISLLECCGKLLEKIVAKRVLHDLNTHHILPKSQFGSRDNHCALDAALVLAHTAQQGIRTGNPVATILFDIQGFYDNICRDRLVHLFDLFGFPDNVVEWIHSFLSDRSVRLAFNGWTSDPFDLFGGTPQGSPLSPIVSAVYTAPLLNTAEQWPDCSLGLYVDDGGLVASGPTHRSATTITASRFEYVTQWMKDVGLRTDPDKTEYIVFYNSRRSVDLIGTPLPRIALRDAANGEITVPRANSVRYLGIYFTYNLSWELHVRTMANRARSTIRALYILGNSIRGLDFANWRKVFHAIVIPALTYGAPIWSSEKRRKKLVDLTRVAQNDALRRISGCFRTNPAEPLNHLLAILPIEHTLDKLRLSFSDRIKRLPPTHAIRTIVLHNPAACWPTWQQSTVPSTLLSLLPSSFPLYTAPSLLPEWSHPLVHSSICHAPSVETRAETRTLLQTRRNLRLLIQLVPSPDGPLGVYLLFHGGDPRAVFSGHRYGPSTTHALWYALIDGMHAAESFPPTPLNIFLPNRALAPYLFKLDKHRFLPQASEFTSSLNSFLQGAEHDQRVHIRWYSVKWTNLPGRDTIAAITQCDRDHPPTSKPISRKDEAYQNWAAQPLPRSSYSARISITMPNGNKPGPFITGVLSHKTRRLFSGCIQLTNRHCFDANYSLRFRPTAEDELACPCNFVFDDATTDGHSDGPAVGGRPTRGRTTTAAGNRRNVTFEELQRRYEDPLDDGADLSAHPGYGEDGERPGSSDRGGHLVHATHHQPPSHGANLSAPAGYGEDGECPGSSDQGGRLVHTRRHVILHTVEHVLTECHLSAPYRTKFLHDETLNHLFGTELGGTRLARFLTFYPSLLRPLPPRPDPP